MKSKIAIVVILLVSIAMFGTGAFAYFTSQQTIAGSTITAGTLTLQLSNDCDDWGTAAKAWEFDGIAPGEFVDQTICMKNTGSIDAGHVYYDWGDLLQTPTGVEIAKKLIIVDIQDNADPGNVVSIFNNDFGIYNLYDLAMFVPGTPGFDAYSGNIYPFLAKDGGEGWLYMKLQFDPNADDTFQGASVQYDLVVEARQQ